MTRNSLLIASSLAIVAQAGVYNVKPDTSPDRVETPLAVDMTRLGTLRPRAAREIRGSNWTLGCEVLDRDFANFEEYKENVEPIGI